MCRGSGRLMADPSTQEIALACGVAGAYVDVTDDLVTDSVSGSWGRRSAFSDTRPGVFSFDLVNDDGKYTPRSAQSSLATAVTLGMGVHHIVDGLHFAGTIRSAQPYFTGVRAEAGAARVRVTCDDLLGDAARHEMGDALTDSLVEAANPYLWWTFGDAAGSAGSVERTGFGPLMSAATVPIAGTATFGVAAVPGLPTTQVRVSDVGAGAYWGTLDGTIQTIPYPAGSLGAWGCWITPAQSDMTGSVVVSLENLPGASGTIVIGSDGSLGVARLQTPLGDSAVYGPAVQAGVPHYYAVVVTQATVAGTTTVYATPYLDGVAFSAPRIVRSWVGAAATNAQATPRKVRIQAISSTGSGSANFSNLTHTTTGPVQEQVILQLTETAVLEAIATAVPEVVFDTLPPGLSTAALGVPDTSRTSALDIINDVIRTEQGYVWSETTGTLLAPVEKVKVRERDRPATVDSAHTFTIAEVLNAPEFLTDIENMVSTATATGPDTSRTATDSTLTSYVGSASDSTSVLLRDGVDLLAWAQDRLLRGATTDLRIPQFTIDALDINRWADVSALRAGDRIRVTGLPLQQLGVDYVDGWLLGASYTFRYPSLHGDDQMLFTFALQPVLAATAIYDDADARFMAGGLLSLSADINSSVTAMSIATSEAATTFTTAGGDLPVTVTIGTEDVEITACTGATPQVATIVRGANGTTAAAHTAGDLIELTTAALYAF
jgi:hypothetical protein